MNYGVYAIKDAKTTFMPANCDYNDAAAIRNFEHACSDDSSLMKSHAKDFTLWRIGVYDNETGMIVPEVPPVQLADGASVVKE